MQTAIYFVKKGAVEISVVSAWHLAQCQVNWQCTLVGTSTAQNLTEHTMLLRQLRKKVKSTGEFVDGSEIGRLGQNAAWNNC